MKLFDAGSIMEKGRLFRRLGMEPPDAEPPYMSWIRSRMEFPENSPVSIRYAIGPPAACGMNA